MNSSEMGRFLSHLKHSYSPCFIGYKTLELRSRLLSSAKAPLLVF